MDHWNRLEARLLKEDFRAGNLLIGFDLDGTLAEIAATPDQARLTPKTRGLLERLSLRSDIRLAVLSGRALDDLRSVVGLRNVFYAGNHGLEIQGPGLRWTHSGAEEIHLAVTQGFEEELSRFPGAFLEHKRLGFALHYRGMESRLLRSLRASVKDRASSIQDRWRVLAGNKSFDVRPNLEWGKGHALAMIRKTLPGGWMAIFVGDAAADEEGFKALGPRALTVRIGRVKTSAAQYLLPQRRMVDRLLELLAEKPRPSEPSASVAEWRT